MFPVAGIDMENRISVGPQIGAAFSLAATTSILND